MRAKSLNISVGCWIKGKLSGAVHVQAEEPLARLWILEAHINARKDRQFCEKEIC